MISHQRTVLWIVSLLSLILLPSPILTQTAGHKRQSSPDTQVLEVDSAIARRAFAIELVISLANEARSYHDLALRPRVLARAADALWKADSVTGRLLFRQAWDAAEAADAENPTSEKQDQVPTMVAALRRATGHDLRTEVLSMAARCDRALGEEFLLKLKAVKIDSKTSSGDAATQNTSDTWSQSEMALKRLQLARKLLDDGEIDRAMEFAAPVLDQLNFNSISFLSSLRLKRSEAADQRFAYLLTRSELDPLSDANTVSGLSSYLFTPGHYVTFQPDGSARWSQTDEPYRPPDVSAVLRNKFFQVAASILLRPLPGPDQDFTSSGRSGKYMVIRRLLPLFDQYAPETAVALRTQLSVLTQGSSGMQRDNSSFLTDDLLTQESATKPLEKMQEQLDMAKTPRERNAIYADVAVSLADQGDNTAQDLADKIDDSNRRSQVRGYVDFQLVQLAVRKKDSSEAMRLAKSGQLTHPQRVWVYIQVARLLDKSQRSRSLELLAEAVDEAKRIDGDDPLRVSTLIAAATGFITFDKVRAWEIMSETVAVANSIEAFTGEDASIQAQVVTRSGLKISSVSGKEFGLAGTFHSLANEDLLRAVELVKSLKKESPRSIAMLAVATAVLDK